MGLDIRFPIGMMFSLLGVMLGVYGWMTRADAGMYRSSIHLNVNLWWGGVLLLFGGLMLLFALLGRRAKKEN